MATTLEKSNPYPFSCPKKATPVPDDPAERHYASKLDRLIRNKEHDPAKERLGVRHERRIATMNEIT